MDFENDYEAPQQETTGNTSAPATQEEVTSHPATSADAKAENFRRIAQSRTNEIIRKIKTLGNLSNRNSYHFTEEQVTTIFSAIEQQVALAKERFQKEEKPESGFIQL